MRKICVFGTKSTAAISAMTAPSKNGLQVVAEGMDNAQREVAFKSSAAKVERVTFIRIDADTADGANDSRGK